MRDRFGRNIDSLRISLNRACNLRCFYCHNEGQLDGAKVMTPEETGRLVGVASQIGIDKVKLTGGEPLLRDDVVEVVRQVAAHASEVSMTTNGVLLAPIAADLAAAGLERVNVSLDSIDPTTYRRICRAGSIDAALEGIDAAIEAGLTPLKVNMVLLKGLNEAELPDMMELAADRGAILQVIEYEVSREEVDQSIYRDHHVDLGPLEDMLRSTAEAISENPLHRRRRYRVDRVAGGPWPHRALSGPVEVEVVRPMHNRVFCDNCRRLRVTSSGLLKGCLFQEKGLVDAVGPMREGASDGELRALFEAVISSRRPYWSEECDAPDGAREAARGDSPESDSTG